VNSGSAQSFCVPRHNDIRKIADAAHPGGKNLDKVDVAGNVIPRIHIDVSRQTNNLAWMQTASSAAAIRSPSEHPSPQNHQGKGLRIALACTSYSYAIHSQERKANCWPKNPIRLCKP
jgi:hypothetical protein